MTEPPSPFRWRNEWPWMAAVASIGVAVRAFIVAYPWRFAVSGDTGIFGLMAKHIWLGQSQPAFFSGQVYIGSLDAWIAAPFYGAVGASWSGVLVVYAALFVLAAPVFYRLLFAIGGRWGATVGLVAIGFGTRPLHELGGWLGYVELLPLAALLYLHHARIAVRGGRTIDGAIIGALVGCGLWLNPQFAAPAMAVGAALAASSVARVALGRPELLARWGGLRARLVRAVAAGLVVQLVAATAYLLVGKSRLAALVLNGTGSWAIATRVMALRHPMVYLTIAGGLALAGWAALELATAGHRRAVLLGGAAVLLGQLPALAYRRGGGEVVHDVPVVFSGTHVADNLPGLAAAVRAQLLGQTPSEPWPWAVVGLAIAAAVAVPAAVAVWLLVRGLVATVRLRPAQLGIPAMLAMQGLVTIAFALLHQYETEERYVATLWLPYVASLAATAGALARHHRGAALALVLIVAVHHGREWASVADECRRSDLLARLGRIEDGIRAVGATRGYSHYDTAYLVNYDTDERILLSSIGGWRARDPFARAAAAAEPAPVVVFEDVRDPDFTAVLERGSAHIARRWRRGPVAFVQIMRPAEDGGWIEVLEGELEVPP